MSIRSNNAEQAGKFSSEAEFTTKAYLAIQERNELSVWELAREASVQGVPYTQLIQLALESGDRVLIKAATSETENESDMIRHAVQNRYFEAAGYLLSTIEMSFNHRGLIQDGDIAVLFFLIEEGAIDLYDDALDEAIEQGRVDIIRALTKRYGDLDERAIASLIMHSILSNMGRHSLVMFDILIQHVTDPRLYQACVDKAREVGLLL